MSKSAAKSVVPAIETAPIPAPVVETPESQNLDSNVHKLPAKRGGRKATTASAIDYKPGIVYNVPFTDLAIEEGYNVRVFNPDILEHRMLAESIRLAGVQTPLTIRLNKDSKPFIVAGHLRAGACDWLSRDGGGKKFLVPSVPVLLRADLSDVRNRTADLGISNSGVKLTVMQKAETAARMVAESYAPSAVAAHLGLKSVKWVGELVKVNELKGTTLADMAATDKITASLALELVKTHGLETAISLAVGAYDREVAKAKFGDTPKVTQGKVNAYLAELAKMKASEPKATPESSDDDDTDESGDKPARETVSPLTAAQGKVAAVRAELSLAEARRKSAKGNSVKKAQRDLDSKVQELADAEAEVAKLTPAPAPAPAPTAEKRGASERTGEHAEKDADKKPATKSEPAMYAARGTFVVVATSGLRIATAAGKPADEASAKARAVWIAEACSAYDAIKPFTD